MNQQFNAKISHLLNEYKATLRRNLTLSAAKHKIAKLHIKRQQLKDADSIILYQTAQLVLADLKLQLNSSLQIASWHSGLDEFYRHFYQVFTEYRLEQNRIIHINQNVSAKLLEAMQLMNLPVDQLDLSIAGQIDQLNKIIAKDGNERQRSLHLKALQTHQKRFQLFFKPLIDSFKRYQDLQAHEPTANSRKMLC